jgi:hypothetical protein
MSLFGDDDYDDIFGRHFGKPPEITRCSDCDYESLYECGFTGGPLPKNLKCNCVDSFLELTHEKRKERKVFRVIKGGRRRGKGVRKIDAPPLRRIK